MDVRAEVVDILAGFALFADLTTPELENLVDTFDEQMFSEDERVVRQGLSSASFYVILDGAATIRVDGKDRATLRPGDFFGEISSCREPRSSVFSSRTHGSSSGCCRARRARCVRPRDG